jgi:rhodanese-related sulfurtransferase
MKKHLHIAGKTVLPLILFAAFVLMTFDGALNTPAAAQKDKISATELISALESDVEVTIIDVRTPREFEHGHIPGSISMPLATLGDVDEIQSDGIVVLYCTAGVRSNRALNILSGKVRTELVELEGGIRTWVSAGGNVVMGPYMDTTEYPSGFEIPMGVCEVLPPLRVVE